MSLLRYCKYISLEVFIGNTDRGFGFGVLCAPARLIKTKTPIRTTNKYI